MIEEQHRIARLMLAMAIFTVLGLGFIGAAAWGLGRAEQSYQQGLV